MIDVGSVVAVRVYMEWQKGKVVHRVGNLVWIKLDKSGEIIVKNRNYKNTIRALK